MTYPRYQDLDQRTPVSLFEEVRAHPALRDWIYEKRMLRAPDRSFDISASWFASRGSIGIYSTAARHIGLRDEEGARSLEHLLEAMGQLPAVSRFLDDLIEVMELMNHLAHEEGLILTQWAESLPCIRATGRHPDGWILTVGCLYLGPGEWEFYAAIVHDIIMARTRSRQHWSTPVVHVRAPLPPALPQALLLDVLALKERKRPDVAAWEMRSDLRQEHAEDLARLPISSRFA